MIRNDACCDIKIDIPRMEEALNSETFTMPLGLSREEKRQFIKDCANRESKDD